MSQRIAALEAEIIMLRACNDVLVKQEQNARVLSNALRAKLELNQKASMKTNTETGDNAATDALRLQAINVELLAALKAVESDLKLYRCLDASPERTYIVGRASIAQLRSVIANATGK